MSDKKRWSPDLHSISAQMIMTSIALVLLTAAAAGLPAILLIRDQLDRQVWAQVEQGSLAAQALYDAQQNELASLATLTAQRPTLHDLLQEGDRETTEAYLRTLQQGSGLDLVLVCDAGEPVAQAGQVAGDLCIQQASAGFLALVGGPSHGAWLFAAHPLDAGRAGALGTAFVGTALDDEFALQMGARTGLEHSVLIDGQTLATSLAGGRTSPCGGPDDAGPAGAVPAKAGRSTFELDGLPYHAACFALDETGLTAQVALEVGEIAVAKQRLAWTLVVGIAVVVAVASLLAVLLARRISRPLDHLSDAAETMSRGDLESPVAIKARVREVALVAQALEGARVDLKRTLAELRREKEWTDHLLEAIVEGIVTLDREGNITFFSHGAERITGWQRDQVLGRACDHVFQPLETDEPFSKLIPRPGLRHKIPVELRDGREAILAVTGARLIPPDGEDAQVALVFRDVSEAETMHRLLGQFLANVAHEFRTPLSALAASVELLMDQAPDLSMTELEELLNSVHLGVLGLQTLIDNLLESASIEAGRFRVYPRISSVTEIIAEAIRVMQPLLDKHGQRLVVGLPAAIPMVQADPRRTVQVMVNLLSNASRYGPDDVEIEIGAAVLGDWVRVTVADTGPGVPPEYRGELFRRFVYPDTGNDRAQVGAGLGLSVVKAVVEAHGGEVGIEDRAGGGSVFWLTLPRVDGK
ncbi:MAG: ATP-binding protein [Anaerolineae bacterium]|jgi:PAS domain S-box-containing protein